MTINYVSKIAPFESEIPRDKHSKTSLGKLLCLRTPVEVVELYEATAVSDRECQDAKRIYQKATGRKE